MSIELTLTKRFVNLTDEERRRIFVEWEFITENPPQDRREILSLIERIPVTASGLEYISNFGITEGGYAFEVYFAVTGLPLEPPEMSDLEEYEVEKVLYAYLTGYPLEMRDGALKAGRIGFMDQRGLCVTFYIDTIDDMVSIINDPDFHDRFSAIAAILEVRINGAMLGLSLQKLHEC